MFGIYALSSTTDFQSHCKGNEKEAKHCLELLERQILPMFFYDNNVRKVGICVFLNEKQDWMKKGGMSTYTEYTVARNSESLYI